MSGVHEQLLADTLYTVSLWVEIQGTVGQVGGLPPGGMEILRAYLDPTFSVDSPNYTLELSPGIGNGAAGGVPETSTWAMMLLGFAGLGYAGFRCRPTARLA